MELLTEILLDSQLTEEKSIFFHIYALWKCIIINRYSKKIMMMSSNGNIFHVAGLLFGEFTGHRWIPLTKASDTESFESFFDKCLEYTVE